MLIEVIGFSDSLLASRLVSPGIKCAVKKIKFVKDWKNQNEISFCTG